MKTTNRLVVLDYLRGFFIIVIIIDHLARWPSLFGYMTGQAQLWVTAAEGFVIISGLLVGYIRGYKNKSLPIKIVTGKLIRRGLLLYVVSILATIIYTTVLWYIDFEGGTPGLEVEVSNWLQLITQTLSLQYTYVWIYFLTLYVVFLVVSPIAVWLLRRNLALVVIACSLITLVVGWQASNHLLQWQALFFIPSVAGFYIPSIISWWNKSTKSTRTILTTTAIVLAVASITTSAILALPSLAGNSTVNWINNVLFSKDTISIWRFMTAFVWFIGYLFVFLLAKPWIDKYLSWLLLPFGTRSLSAYTIHGVAICLISYITIATDSLIINTLLDILSIAIVWVLLKTRLVQKFIPH